MIYSNESYSREDEKVRRVSCWQVSEFSITFFQLLRTQPDSYFACVISRETDVKPTMFTLIVFQSIIHCQYFRITVVIIKITISLIVIGIYRTVQ